MARDFHEEYLDRVERAHEAGFSGLREQTEWRSFAREMGADSREEVNRYAEMFHDHTPGHWDEDGWHAGDMDIEDFREVWMELNDIDEWDDSYDDDFYAWLQEYYSQN